MGALVLAETLIFLGCSATGLAVPPAFYSAKEIRATVVDEETGRPLEGVVAVAIWQLEPSGLQIRLQVTEAVTDAQGQFFIPGWGPKPRQWGWLGHRSPLLILFKHGYTPLELHNESPKEVERLYPNYRAMPTKQLRNLTAWYQGAPDDPVQESMWDGLTIQLEPFRGTPDRWLFLLNSHVNVVRDEDAKSVTKFLEAIKAERRYFDLNPVAGRERASLESLFSRVNRLLKKAAK